MATNILYEGDLDENDNWRKPIMLGYKILHGAIQRKWYFRNEKLVIIGYRIMHGCDLNGNEHFKNRNYSFDLLGSRINVICWGSRTSFPIFSDWVRVVCSSFLHVQSLQTRVRIFAYRRLNIKFWSFAKTIYMYVSNPCIVVFFVLIRTHRLVVSTRASSIVSV